MSWNSDHLSDCQEDIFPLQRKIERFLLPYCTLPQTQQVKTIFYISQLHSSEVQIGFSGSVWSHKAEKRFKSEDLRTSSLFDLFMSLEKLSFGGCRTKVPMFLLKKSRDLDLLLGTTLQFFLVTESPSREIPVMLHISLDSSCTFFERKFSTFKEFI